MISKAELEAMGCVLWLPLYNDVKDYSDKNHTTTLDGAIPKRTSDGLGSYGFDGVNDTIILTKDDDFYLGNGDWGISVWINITSYKDFNNQYGNAIIGSGVETNTFGYVLYITSTYSGSGTVPHKLTGVVYSTRYSPTYQFFGGTTTVSLNTWHHVVATRRSGTTYLYLNTVEECSSTLYEDNNTSDNVTIGQGYPNVAVNYYFNGNMSNFMMFNKALSEEQINYIYEKTYIR